MRITELTNLGTIDELPDDRTLWKKPLRRSLRNTLPEKPLSFNVPPDGSDAANFDLKSDPK